MLNPSLNHRSATRTAVFAICVMAASVTLPLAAMRAPEQTTKLWPRQRFLSVKAPLPHQREHLCESLFRLLLLPRRKDAPMEV